MDMPAATDPRDLPELTPQNIESFWKRVDKTPESGCWLWTGRRKSGPTPYGELYFPEVKSFFPAHRISRTIHFGPIAPGELVLHRCDNPPCVNPDHLFLGDKQLNAVDMTTKGRRRGPEHVPGYRHPKRKISDTEAAHIRELYASGSYSQKAIATLYGLHQVTISEIVLDRRYKTADKATKPHPLAEAKRGRPGAKLTLEQVAEIHRLYRTGNYRQDDLAAMFGVSQWSIWAIVRMKSYL